MSESTFCNLDSLLVSGGDTGTGRHISGYKSMREMAYL
jgi:hypothetical protein